MNDNEEIALSCYYGLELSKCAKANDKANLITTSPIPQEPHLQTLEDRYLESDAEPLLSVNHPSIGHTH